MSSRRRGTRRCYRGLTDKTLPTYMSVSPPNFLSPANLIKINSRTGPKDNVVCRCQDSWVATAPRIDYRHSSRRNNHISTGTDLKLLTYVRRFGSDADETENESSHAAISFRNYSNNDVAYARPASARVNPTRKKNKAVCYRYLIKISSLPSFVCRWQTFAA